MTSSVRRVAAAALSLVFAAGAALTAGAPVAAATPSYVFKTGSDAASYSPPADLHQVFSWTDTKTGVGDLVFTRYQQQTTASGEPVDVNGAQVTVVSQGGQNVLVAGMYAQNTTPTSKPALTPSQAISIAAGSASAKAASTNGANLDTGSPATRSAQLMLNPNGGRLFFKVTSAQPGNVVYTSVDATTGAVLESWSGIQNDGPAQGTGVKGDTKNLAGADPLAGDDALTSKPGTAWLMQSPRYFVSDAAHKTSYPTTGAMSDASFNNDDNWDAASQKAAVDAQYYAALTDNYYRTERGFDLPGCLGAMQDPAQPILPIHSIVHYGSSYANAFWDEQAQVMAYGDGDGKQFGQMSGGQDVVSHELTHAVTSCRAELDYQKESGALNEAFSDIMGSAAEFDLEEPLSSNCKLDVGQSECADWWLGEDLIIGGSDHAIRSLAHPQLLDQPSHYSQRAYKTCSPSSFNDYCGVHTNSGIANHAFYLTVAGGRNARCSGPTDPQADCDVVVRGIPIDDAAHIYFDAWQMLTSRAQFCAARDATVAIADVLFPNDAAHHAAADLGWRAVGVGSCVALTGLNITPSTRSVAAKPGGSAALNLTVTQSAGTTDFTTSDAAPATASFSPTSSVTGTGPISLQLDVPADADAGLYPLTVTATDGSTTQVLSLVLVVDADAPTASVGRASLGRLDTVATDGHVPLHLSWTTADATSGVATGALSVDSVQVASGVSGSAVYQSLDGSHDIAASATDGAGNSASAAPLAVSQTSFQESAATYTKPRTWSVLSGAPAWGTNRFSKTKGATASLTFTGTDVAWVSALGPRRGKAKVYIDGVLKGPVDLYAKVASTRRVVYFASGLAPGQHTITIWVNGTSGRPRVDIDGFVVLAQ